MKATSIPYEETLLYLIKLCTNSLGAARRGRQDGPLQFLINCSHHASSFIIITVTRKKILQLGDSKLWWEIAGFYVSFLCYRIHRKPQGATINLKTFCCLTQRFINVLVQVWTCNRHICVCFLVTEIDSLLRTWPGETF